MAAIKSLRDGHLAAGATPTRRSSDGHVAPRRAARGGPHVRGQPRVGTASTKTRAEVVGIDEEALQAEAHGTRAPRRQEGAVVPQGRRRPRPAPARLPLRDAQEGAAPGAPRRAGRQGRRTARSSAGRARPFEKPSTKAVVDGARRRSGPRAARCSSPAGRWTRTCSSRSATSPRAGAAGRRGHRARHRGAPLHRASRRRARSAPRAAAPVEPAGAKARRRERLVKPQHVHDVLLRPLVTEKSLKRAERRNTYTFEVRSERQQDPDPRRPSRRSSRST